MGGFNCWVQIDEKQIGFTDVTTETMATACSLRHMSDVWLPLYVSQNGGACGLYVYLFVWVFGSDEAVSKSSRLISSQSPAEQMWGLIRQGIGHGAYMPVCLRGRDSLAPPNFTKRHISITFLLIPGLCHFMNCVSWNWASFIFE